MDLTNEYLKMQRSQRTEVFSQYLKQARKKTGLSIRQLAEKTTVSAAYLSKLENNKVDGLPSQEIISKLYFYLKVPLEEMLQIAGYSAEDIDYVKEASPSKKEDFSINDVDLMSGDEFETFIQRLLGRIYYTDPIIGEDKNHADMIINDKNGPIIVQINRYSHLVTYDRIKGLRNYMSKYDSKKGVIISNDYFSNLIVDLAIENNIVLWDRHILKDKVLDSY